jgi:predicted nuclease of restriction endonuclease-like (RecB) superfamily
MSELTQPEEQLYQRIATILEEAKSRVARQIHSVVHPGQNPAPNLDILQDPAILEFLDLKGTTPPNLEQALINRLKSFLLELDKGFCFVARQKRLTVEGEHFYVALVFYNRLLQCFVLVDLKLGKLTDQDIGQMQMYVNYFDRFQRADNEAKTIGIILCSDKNDAVVKITLPEENQPVRAERYQLYLPSKQELQAALARERDEAERQISLMATSKPVGS